MRAGAGVEGLSVRAGICGGDSWARARAPDVARDARAGATMPGPLDAPA